MGYSFERLCEQANATVRDVAEKSGLDIDRVQAILAGRWLPSPAERAAIAAALDVKPEDVDWGHTMSPRNVRYHRFGFPDGDASEEDE